MPLGQHVPAQRANLTTTSFLTSGLSNAPTRRLSLQVAMWRSSARQLARQSSRLFFPEQRSSAGETSTLSTSCACSGSPPILAQEAAFGKLDPSLTYVISLQGPPPGESCVPQQAPFLPAQGMGQLPAQTTVWVRSPGSRGQRRRTGVPQRT